MPYCRLVGITCQKTQETKDELYLWADRDTSHGSLDIGTVWGPTRMDDGEARTVNRTLWFETYCRIELWENDLFRDDYIGALMITPRDIGRGEQSYLFSGEGARATLTFIVTEEERTAPNWILELISLDCDDAQERTDEPYLVVNDRRVWGPVDMISGDRQRIDIEVPFNDEVKIELWEADRFRSDKIERVVVPGRTEEGAELTFNRRWSPKINARYTLSYRIRRA